MNKLSIKLRGQILFEYPRIARSFWARLKGLLGTDSIDYEACLLFYRCSSVHNFFMKYTIGVIYLDKDDVVIDYEVLKPWKIGKIIRRTNKIIECNVDKLQDLGLKIGDQVEIIDE